MKLLVVGATRGIGLEVTRQALDQGHVVTVLARSPNKVPLSNPRLTVMKGDVLQAASVERAVGGQEVVCCTVGTGLTFKPVRLFSEGTRNIIVAMKQNGVQRLICVTGIGAGDSRNHGGFFYDRIVLPFLIRSVYDDKERQEELVRASGLDWIIVRPGFLTNGPATGRYMAATDLRSIKAGRISRADVADFILAQLSDPQFLGTTPLLTY
jgi:putative NADH-flavin reductase